MVAKVEDGGGRTSGQELSSVSFSILLYADDIVLIATQAERMQRMLKACEAEADRLGFEFNAQKCKAERALFSLCRWWRGEEGGKEG